MSLWLAPVDNGKPAGEPMLVRRDAELAAAVPMGFPQNGGLKSRAAQAARPRSLPPATPRATMRSHSRGR